MTTKYASTAASSPYLIQFARCSSLTGTSTRSLRGTIGVHQLRERAERADAPAVETAPQHRRRQHEEREQVPRQVVLEHRQVQVRDREQIDDRHEPALDEPHVADRRRERDVLQPHALAEKAHERQRHERHQEGEVERLGAEDVRPRFDRVHYFTASGSSCFATIRELSRIARVALPMLIDARDTASTSLPTMNGSRMVLPLNCAANFGGSTEK